MHYRTALIATALALGALSGQARAQDPSALVYYQVTRADGEVRDMFQPPQSNEKIVSVVRISRYDSPRKQTTLVSTETGMTRYNAPRVVRQDMQWDGQSWVAPAPAGAGQAKPVEPEAAVAKAILAEARRIGKQLKTARASANSLQQEVADAQQIYNQLSGQSARAAAERQLEKAKARLQEAQSQVQTLQSALEVILGSDDPMGDPTGKVGMGTITGQGVAGIAKAIDKLRVLPHRVQVWPMPQAAGWRSVRVSMAHPEAGPGGAFCYVAYADTDGDGKPDALIGRSPLVSAPKAGQWSHWDFQTDSKAVFVGNAWTGGNVPVYCRKFTPADRGGNWTTLGSEVWVSGFFGAKPDQKFWPYLSNIRVRLVDQPDGPALHQVRDR